MRAIRQAMCNSFRFQFALSAVSVVLIMNSLMTQSSRGRLKTLRESTKHNQSIREGSSDYEVLLEGPFSRKADEISSERNDGFFFEDVNNRECLRFTCFFFQYGVKSNQGSLLPTLFFHSRAQNGDKCT